MSTSIIEKRRYWHLAKPSPSPTGFDNLGFVIKRKFLLYCIIPCSWGFPTSSHHLHFRLRGGCPSLLSQSGGREKRYIRGGRGELLFNALSWLASLRVPPSVCTHYWAWPTLLVLLVRSSTMGRARKTIWPIHFFGWYFASFTRWFALHFFRLLFLTCPFLVRFWCWVC